MGELDKFGVPYECDRSVLKVGTRVKIQIDKNSWGGGLSGLRPGDISSITEIQERESEHHKYKYWVCLSRPGRPKSDWAYAGCFSILPLETMIISDDGNYSMKEETK